MGKIEKVSAIVKDTLMQYPDTRNSDALLYVKVCKTMNPSVSSMKFEDVMLEQEKLCIANYETVRRARQKIQADNDELKASDKVTDLRYEQWKEYREYATS